MSVQETGQTDEPQLDGQESSVDRVDAGSEPKDWATFGVLVYGTTAVGMFLTFFIGLTVGDEESILLFSEELLAGEELFMAAAVGAEQLLFLAPLIAVGVGLYYQRSADLSVPAPKPAAIAAGTGTAVGLLFLTLLLVLFEPDVAQEFGMDGSLVNLGDELPTIVGITVGSAIAAALTAFAFEKNE